MNRRTKQLATTFVLALVDLAFVHSMALADGKIHQIGQSTSAKIKGSVQFNCMASADTFPRTAPCNTPLPVSGTTLSLPSQPSCAWIALATNPPYNCSAFSQANLYAWNTLDQVPPTCGCRAYVIGEGSAGLTYKGRGSIAAVRGCSTSRAWPR